MVDVRKAAGDTLEYHKVGVHKLMHSLDSYFVSPYTLFHERLHACISYSSYISCCYFLQFYKNFCAKLEEIIWKPKEGMSSSNLVRTMTC